MKLRHALAATLLAFASMAQADVVRFFTTFAPEAAGATGSGSADVTFDSVSHVLTYAGSFSGLSGTATQAHFHCCTAVPFAGTAGIAVDSPSLFGFPVGATSGAFNSFLDLDDPNNFNATFLSGAGGTTDLAIAKFLAGISSHSVYLNIHSSTFPGGEIRGFLVPEPGTVALALLAFGAMGIVRRRRPHAQPLCT